MYNQFVRCSMTCFHMDMTESKDTPVKVQAKSIPESMYRFCYFAYAILNSTHYETKPLIYLNSESLWISIWDRDLTIFFEFPAEGARGLGRTKISYSLPPKGKTN